MRKLKAEGRTIVFISHKLEEVMSVADAITVMRVGRVVATTTPATTSLAELAAAMVGEPIETGEASNPCARLRPSPYFSARGSSVGDTMGVRAARSGRSRRFSAARSSALPASAATARTNSSPAPPG